MTYLRRVSVPRALWAILLAALTLRILVIFVDASFGVLGHHPPISSGHNARAVALASGWEHGQFFVPLKDRIPPTWKIGPRRTFVAHAIAPFYLVFGLSSVAGRIGMAVYGTAIGGVTYALAREAALKKRPALLAAGLTAFWPSIVYRSIVIQREVFVVLALLAVVWVALRWTRTPAFARSPRVRAVEGVLLALACWALYILRAENLVIVGALALAVLAVRYRTHRRVLAGTAVLAVVGVGVVVASLNTLLGPSEGSQGIPVYIDRFAHHRAYGGSAYLTWVHYHTWFDIIVFAPLKVVYYLASPMPWQVNGVADALAGISGWLLLAATLLALYGVVAVVRRVRRGPAFDARPAADWRAVAVLCVFVVVGVTAYAVIEMNAGAAFRRRIQFVPAVLVLTVVGIYRVRRYGRRLRSRTGNTGKTIG